MKHPEFEKLLHNFEGLLSPDEAQEVSAHLNECAECRPQAEKLSAFFNYALAGENESVPQATTARLLNIYEPQPKKGDAAKTEYFGRRLFAALIFDDWRQALNERFSATDSRHLVFRGEEFEIDLRLEFIGEKCLLSGQIFPDLERQAIAEISSDAASEKVFLNEHCEFDFPPLSGGEYVLRIVSGDLSIEIENLSLVD